ncbi:MAG: hypothetical protein V7K48_20720 [Nostoc sp.]|uniref:hypothetical protein n=1 Tax=Nostoc sp. TaxID=1180 RepID=UPI002FF683F0
MTSQLNISNNKTRKEASPLSDTPTPAMFELHPFVVQSKSDHQLQLQQPDLKTSLMQAEKYGHHLNKFQPRPFVVQSKKDNVQQPDLKTSLMQTENYGYHLHNMQTGGDSNTTAVQAKKARESGNAEVIQMVRAPKRQRTTSGRSRTPYSRPVNSQSQSRTTYSPGQHGYKTREQQRLRDEYKIPIDGNSTHQSEHTIGFEPLNQTSGLTRKQNGKLENKAPAYQEMYQPHRDHIGTGTKSRADASGFNSESYRNSQRHLLESGDVSSAVQINQLGYAFDPNFRNKASTPQGLAATNSYNTMVNNMQQVEYAQGANNVTVPVNRLKQQEMLLAREAATTGEWPSQVRRANFNYNRTKMENQSNILLRGQQRQQEQLSAMDLS